MSQKIKDVYNKMLSLKNNKKLIRLKSNLKTIRELLWNCEKDQYEENKKYIKMFMSEFKDNIEQSDVFAFYDIMYSGKELPKVVSTMISNKKWEALAKYLLYERKTLKIVLDYIPRSKREYYNGIQHPVYGDEYWKIYINNKDIYPIYRRLMGNGVSNEILTKDNQEKVKKYMGRVARFFRWLNNKKKKNLKF